MEQIITRIESRPEVETYLARLRYALEQNAQLTFQIDRRIDTEKDLQYTNRYTIANQFPNEDPVSVLKRELKTLRADEYMRTVKDLRFPQKSEMREFGRTYDGMEDIYIKIRVELVDHDGQAIVFVMSFHYAVVPFNKEMFPYHK